MALLGSHRILHVSRIRVNVQLCISCKLHKVPLPGDLADLKPRIVGAVKTIDAPMLTRLWQELAYRIDVCRVTRRAHTQHL